MKNKLLSISFFLLLSALSIAQPTMENLGRGLVAVKNGGGVFLSWRLLGNEAYNTGFNVYRDDALLTTSPITNKTNYIDASGTVNSTYSVTPVNSGVEGAASQTVSVWANNIKRINLNRPATVGDPATLGASNTDNYEYSPNDCSVGDVDGDGEYEIILKWDPSNSRDNMPVEDEYTGKVYIDAYEMDGTQLWRLDLGVNIRAGAHITQFLVYDFDLDGKAEVVLRTAPGTKDGLGNYLNNGPAAADDDEYDYRNSGGMVVSGPEYITVFNGLTGEEVCTTTFQPARGNIAEWGDDWGNRVDRFLAGVAYLDGVTPSIILGRGYYHGSEGFKAKSGIAAYSFNGTSLSNDWTFWADETTNFNIDYVGQGCHSLSIADVDQDGYDEVIYGSMTIDHDGTGLYSTDLRHGDALHVSDLDPTRDGLELFQVHEEPEVPYGMSFRDAKTGEVIWGFDSDDDIGRGVSADIDPNHLGYESWSSMNGSIYDCKGNEIWTTQPTTAGGGNSCNHLVWWDGDLLSEILDRTVLTKFDYNTGNTSRLWTLYNEGVSSNNGTKSNPCLTADLYGDWREEIILRSSDNTQLVIFNTTIETEHKLYTLMSDPVYRCAVAWQNSGYNQPPHVGYYLGAGMSTPTKPNITILGNGNLSRYNFASSSEGNGAFSMADGEYLEDDYTITAIPDQGWTFSHWSGDLTGSENPTTLPLNSNKSVMAHFEHNADGWNTYQAESGSWSSGAIDNEHDGYTGDGFVNTDNETDEWVQIQVYAAYSQPYDLRIFFANGSTTDRATSIEVNGSEQVASVSLLGNGAWDVWQEAQSMVTLNEGNNTIRFKALTGGGVPNLDRIELLADSSTGLDNTGLNSVVVCYPTVVDDLINVKIDHAVKASVTISIVDLAGSVYAYSEVKIVSRNQVETLNLSNIGKGIYLVKMQIGEKSVTQKIIKK